MTKPDQADAHARHRTLPRDLDAERAVLGGTMLCEQIPEGFDLLCPEDFYSPAHGKIFSAMSALAAEGKPVDERTVADKLRGQPGISVASVAELSDQVPTAANTAHYAEIVRKTSRWRKQIRALREAYGAALAEGADVDAIAGRALAELGEIEGTRSTGTLVHVADVARETFRAIQASYERKSEGGVVGLSTGIATLDRQTGGFGPGDLVVLAARPSMGKTALALNMLANATREGKAAVLLSLEQSLDQIGRRLIAAESGVGALSLHTGQFAGTAFPAITQATADLSRRTLHLADRGVQTLDDVRAVLRAHAARHPVDVVAVDYLQLLTADGSSREQQVSAISRGLKALAKELRCPVIALSQLNRSLEQRQNKRPILSDLRESGAIEQDADVILFVYRDEYYHLDSPDQGIAEVSVSKSRNGPIGMARLRFQKATMRFRDLREGEG